jgi:integrase
MGFEAPRELSRGRHPALAYDQMTEFMKELRARPAVTARALEFLILANMRTDAVLKAIWEQFDLDEALWTVPLASLKDREHRTEPFRVPLSPRAVAIVREMEKLRVSNFVFPGQGEGPLSNMSMLMLLKRLNPIPEAPEGDGVRKMKPRWADPVSGRPITAHGFRATFRTWAEEVSTSPHAVIEQAMGRRVGGKVERAYRRSDVLEKRRELFDAWANHCEPVEAGNVVPIRRGANV